MEIRVLGCHGGESVRHRPTAFLIDGVLAVDAGGLTGALSLREQRAVRHLLVTHSHLDHVRDLATLADNLVGSLDRPVDLIAMPATLAALRRHFLNGVIWPDFTRIPTPARPVLRLRPIRPGGALRVGRYHVRSVPVNHPVPSSAFIVRGPGARAGAVAFSGDTGPTKRLWTVLNSTPRLRALLIELSFPDRMQKLADLVGHLTPRTLSSQLERLRAQVPVLLYHLKPSCAREIEREVLALGRNGLRVLRLGDRFRF